MPDRSPGPSNVMTAAHVPSDRRADDFVTIEIAKEAFNFSAGHFTMFSATEREDLHGHNWRVACEVTAPVGDAGLCFDYNIVKRRLMALIESLDEKMLMPGASPWLTMHEEGDYLVAHFADEKIPFLPRDVLVLDVRNVSVEEMAGWILEQLLADETIAAQDLVALRVGVASGTNQWGWRSWRTPGTSG